MNIKDILIKLNIANSKDIIEVKKGLDRLCDLEEQYWGFVGYSVFGEELEVLEAYIKGLEESCKH